MSDSSSNTFRDLLVRYMQNHPVIYRSCIPFSKSLKPAIPTYCRRTTDVVIEGYPRSGNTFAYKAFTLSQGERPIHVASHHHTQAQILQAVKYHVPALILVRRPEEALRSALVRAPNLSPYRAVRKYIEFHEDIEPHHEHFLVVDFNEVIRDFGPIIGRLNSKFDRNFAWKPFTPVMNEEVLASLREDVRLNPHCTVEGVAAPSREKDAAKEKCDLSSITEELKIASVLWQRFLSLAESDAVRFPQG